MRGTSPGAPAAGIAPVAARRAALEVGPLAALAALGLFGTGFLVLAGLIARGDPLAFDRGVLLALRRPDDLAEPIGPPWFTEAVRDVTGLGGTAILVLVTASAVVYLAMTGKRRAGLFVLAAIGGGALVAEGLKRLFERPRPNLVPHGMEVFTTSFPSSHAMLSAVAYLTLATLLARVEAHRSVKAFLIGLGVAVTLLVGASRIYLGVHWPSDVLAGWCVGAAWASLCWLAALRLQRRGEVEPAGPAR